MRNFKAGDMVTVRSKTEIAKTFTGDTRHTEVSYGLLYFHPNMEQFCGRTFTVYNTTPHQDNITLKTISSWTWDASWLEPLVIDNRRIAHV